MTELFNIALLHYSAPPVVGGVESVVAAHANLLAAAGHTVRVVAGRGAQWRDDVPVILLPLADSRAPAVMEAKQHLDAGVVPSGFDALRAAILEQVREAVAGCDLLICHNVCSLAKNLPLVAALHTLSAEPDAPAMVLWHHDLAWTTPRYAAELHDGFPWNLLKQPWLGVTQVAISALRQQELAALMGLPQDEIHVVPNGVDLAAFFKLDPWTQELLERTSLLESDPLLLLPVRLTPRKNIELALSTLAALREIMPNARLLVSGPMGPHNPANLAYFERLKRQRDDLGLQGAAIFLAERSDEFLPDAIIADLYRLADALLFPSREEGFGIPMLEAGLSHLPIFAAEIDPLVQLGGKNVTWFSPDADPQELARRMAENLQHSPVQGMARTARSYTWNRILDTKIQPLLVQAVSTSAALRRNQID